VVDDEGKESKQELAERRKAEREAEARKQRRQELETRIGLTHAGHEWLKRVNRIGKGGGPYSAE
jgi:hypothetical protein